MRWATSLHQGRLSATGLYVHRWPLSPFEKPLRPCGRVKSSAAFARGGRKDVSPMAHHQRAVTIAVALNTGIFIAEAVAGYQASSLSLVMDSVHNLSDEMALIALWLAFIVARGPSKTLLRGANAFNSMGLLAVSAVLLWQAVERFLNPVPVNGVLPIVVGLAAAVANYGVARSLRGPAEH